jgi:hypothetical protein
MSPSLSPSTTTPPLVAVLVVLSPRVMSPKPRLNAPCWALAPASWFGLSSGTLLPLSRSVLLRLASSVLVSGAKLGESRLFDGE